MKAFLPDATDFTDVTVKDAPSVRFPDMTGPWAHCPVCKGHGTWNLEVNAYGPGKHFQAFCSQCWGWGWVKADGADAACVHEFVEVKPDQSWRCWHTIRCTKCGHTKSYDSSD